RREVREGVRLADGMKALEARGCEIYVEIGPGTTLTALGRKCVEGGDWLASLRKGKPDRLQILESLARLYVEGADVRWAKVDQGHGRRKVFLPTYPFQREPCWVERAAYDHRPPTEARRNGFGGREVHPLLGERLRSALRDVQYESAIGLDRLPYLSDHCVYGHAVFPAAAWLEMAFAAAADAVGSGSVEVEENGISNPLLPRGGGGVRHALRKVGQYRAAVGNLRTAHDA